MELPQVLQWPPDESTHTAMPSVLALIGMSNAYIIELLRPYVTNPATEAAVPDSLAVCMKAADEIVEIMRYVRDFYGVHQAPLTCIQ